MASKFLSHQKQPRTVQGVLSLISYLIAVEEGDFRVMCAAGGGVMGTGFSCAVDCTVPFTMENQPSHQPLCKLLVESEKGPPVLEFHGACDPQRQAHCSLSPLGTL